MADGVLGGDRSHRAAFCPLRTLAACRGVAGRGWSRAPTTAEFLVSPNIRGAATPDGLQHLLARASWDVEAVRDDLRDYVIDAFGDRGAILVVDETGDVKKGVHSVGVQRQYSGMRAVSREFSSGGVSDLCRAPARPYLIDRALYPPKSWSEGRRPVCRRPDA